MTPSIERTNAVQHKGKGSQSINHDNKPTYLAQKQGKIKEFE